MNWLAVIVAFVLGEFSGFFVAAICVAASRDDEVDRQRPLHVVDEDLPG